LIAIQKRIVFLSGHPAKGFGPTLPRLFEGAHLKTIADAADIDHFGKVALFK
jgi:hypothetical protein